MLVTLGVLVAKTVVNALESKGIYELVIECANSGSSVALSCAYENPGLHGSRTSTQKHQYLWGAIPSAMPAYARPSPRRVSPDFWLYLQMDRDIEVTHIERVNTVRTLRDQLAKFVAAGFADTEFPILRGGEDGSSRMLGFISGSELEQYASIRPSIS